MPLTLHLSLSGESEEFVRAMTSVSITPADVIGCALWLLKTAQDAYLVVACYFALLATVVLVGWMILRLNTEDMLKVLTTTAGVVGGIVGAAVGFYFQARA